MSRKLFLDTNILLDAAIGERPGWLAATLLIDEFLHEDVQGYIAASSLKDVYYILTKCVGEEEARAFMSSLADLFEIVSVDAAICRVAIASDEPDYEDGVIRACAESVPVDFIISRDTNAFARSAIKRLSAQDYLDLFCEIKEIDLPC